MSSVKYDIAVAGAGIAGDDRLARRLTDVVQNSCAGCDGVVGGGVNDVGVVAGFLCNK